MAKTQGLSLNPTKISGICGRLMCCLSYENEFYAEISSKMPKLGGKVKTKDGVGTVVYNNLLKQKVTVKIENENDIKISEYDVGDIEVLAKTIVPNQKKENVETKPNNNTVQEKKINKKDIEKKEDNNQKPQNNSFKNNKNKHKKFKNRKGNGNKTQA